MQCNWDVPDRISLRNRTTRVWVDTLAYRIAVRDVSSSIAGRLATDGTGSIILTSDTRASRPCPPEPPTYRKPLPFCAGIGPIAP